MELDLQNKNLHTLDFSEMLAGPTPRNADDGGSNPTADQDEVCAARETLHLGVVKIDAQSNRISYIGALHYFQALAEIDLSHNNLSIVRGDIWPRSLQKLDLSSNNLRHISFLLQMQCPHLQWLNVSGNENLTSLGWGPYCEQRARELQQQIASLSSSTKNTIPEELQNEIGPLLMHRHDHQKIPVSVLSLQVLQLSECENLDSLDGICLARNLVELYVDRCDLSSASSFFGVSNNRLVHLLAEGGDSSNNTNDMKGFSTSPVSIAHRLQARSKSSSASSSANTSDHDHESENEKVKVVSAFFPKLEVVDISENPLSHEEVDLIKFTLSASPSPSLIVAPCLDIKSHFLSAGCEETYQALRRIIQHQDLGLPVKFGTNDESRTRSVNDDEDEDQENLMIAYVQHRLREQQQHQQGEEEEQDNDPNTRAPSHALVIHNNNSNHQHHQSEEEEESLVVVSPDEKSRVSSCAGGDKPQGTGRHEEEEPENHQNEQVSEILIAPSDASTIHSANTSTTNDEQFLVGNNAARNQQHEQEKQGDDDDEQRNLLKELDSIRAMLISNEDKEVEKVVRCNDQEDVEISHGNWTAPRAAKTVIRAHSVDADDEDLEQSITSSSSVVSSATNNEENPGEDRDSNSSSSNQNQQNALLLHHGPAGTPPLVLSAKKKHEMDLQQQQEQNQREEQERLILIKESQEEEEENLFKSEAFNYSMSETELSPLGKSQTLSPSHHQQQQKQQTSEVKQATSRILFNEEANTVVSNEKPKTISVSEESQQQKQLREQVMHFRAKRLALEEEKKQLVRDLAKSRKDSAETARCIVDLKKMKNESTKEAEDLKKQLSKTKREVQYAMNAKKIREQKKEQEQQQQSTTNISSSASSSGPTPTKHQDPSKSAVAIPTAVSPSPIHHKNDNKSPNHEQPHHFSSAETAAIHTVQEAAARNLQKAALDSDRLFRKREKDRQKNLRPEVVLGSLNAKAPGSSPIFKSQKGRDKYEQVLAPAPLRDVIRREKMQQEQQKQKQVRPSSTTNKPTRPSSSSNKASSSSNNTFSFVYTSGGSKNSATTTSTTTKSPASSSSSRVLSLRMPNRPQQETAVKTNSNLNSKIENQSTHSDDQESSSLSSSSSSNVFLFQP